MGYNDIKCTRPFFMKLILYWLVIIRILWYSINQPISDNFKLMGSGHMNLFLEDCPSAAKYVIMAGSRSLVGKVEDSLVRRLEFKSTLKRLLFIAAFLLSPVFFLMELECRLPLMIIWGLLSLHIQYKSDSITLNYLLF